MHESFYNLLPLIPHTTIHREPFFFCKILCFSYNFPGALYALRVIFIIFHLIVFPF